MAPIARISKEIGDYMTGPSTHLRWTKSAIAILRESAEDFGLGFLQDCNMASMTGRLK